MGEKRLPQRVVFRELVEDEGYSGEQEKDWMAHLKDGGERLLRRPADGFDE